MGGISDQAQAFLILQRSLRPIRCLRKERIGPRAEKLFVAIALIKKRRLRARRLLRKNLKPPCSGLRISFVKKSSRGSHRLEAPLLLLA
jgi:hypothetical protein